MKNFKINTNRPPLTDAELAPKGDFNQVLKTYKAMKTPFFKTPKLWFGASAALVASVAALIIFSKLADMETAPAPFVNPPIAQADIKSDSYLIDAESDSNITYTSGSKIHIPANAFVDDKGVPVKGKVELKYREFTKMTDVFLAGIPMTYDSVDEQFHFETAGMMEISASQNGKPLKTNPDAFITVDMVSSNAEDRFNTYYLDTTKKQWIYLAQKNYNEVKEEVAEAISSDTIAAAQPAPELVKLQKEIAQLQQQKPLEPKKINKDKHRFNIRVDEKEFPEIAVYSNMKFEVADKGYDAKKAQILWENVELKRIEGSANYEVVFSNAKERYAVVASPVFEDKDIKDAQKIYEEKYKEYQTKLSKRKADEVKLKAELEARAKAVEEKIQQEIAEMAQRRKEYEAKLQQSELVYRTFQVASFGIWNCDCPARLPQGACVVANLTDAKTKRELKVQTCYLVEKGRNAMFTYYPESLKYFRYNPNKENIIWAVTNDLKVAFIRTNDFKAAKAKGGELQLELNVIDKSFKSSEEVKEYLEI
jgi:hypothetical protein